MTFYTDDEIPDKFLKVYILACEALKKQLPLLKLQGMKEILDERAKKVTIYSVAICRWNNLEESGENGSLSREELEFFVKRDVNREFVDGVVSRYVERFLYPDHTQNFPDERNPK